MACPYFEPRTVAHPASHPNARLPLIDEYEGLCRANGVSFTPSKNHLFRYCNHGNAEGLCGHFPAGANDVPTSLRYHVAAQDDLHLFVLMVEEKRHWPQAWRRVSFEMASERLDPDVPNGAGREQLLAFCRSYLRRAAG